MNSPTADTAESVGHSRTRPLLDRTIPARRANFDKFILLQVAWCTFPALVLIRVGQLKAGSIWCFVFLLVFLGWYALKRNIPAFVALTVATLPALSYTRGYFLYNSVVVLLGLGICFWCLRSPKEGLRIWNNHLIRWFFIAGTVYWALSVLITRQYHANLMVIEMLCSAGSIYLLAQYPRYLATGLIGMGISIFSVAVGMIGQGDRLGMADIEGEHVGNPITFGAPTALLLLLAMADNGRWLLLQHSTMVKNLLIAMCSILLLLSTSRGSWLVALVGIGVAILYQSQNRKRIIIAILLVLFLIPIVMQTESGKKVSEYVAEKIINPEKSLSEQTTGRLPQWILFLNTFQDSPIWGVGPGLGKEAFAYYSWVDKEVTYRQGQKMAWHSMYMHVGIETGMIGLTLLALLLGITLFKAIKYRNWTRQVIPLVGILGLMTIGISVSGFGGIGGLYLGLAFLGTVLPKRKLAKDIASNHSLKSRRYVSNSVDRPG